MVKYENSITTHQPIGEVFAYVSELQNSPQWQPGLVEVRRITEGLLGIGTQYTAVRKFMGRKVEANIEYVAYEQNKKITFKSISGPMPFEQTFLFESTNDGTLVTSLFEIQPGGLAGLAEPLIAASIKRENDTDIEILKNKLDTLLTRVSS